MKKGLVLAVILLFSGALIGCAGMNGNVQERRYYSHQQRICDDHGCRNQFVEDEYVSDEPAYSSGGGSYLSVQSRIGRNGHVGFQSWSGNGNGYNGYPGGYGYYNGGRPPVFMGVPVGPTGHPLPVWLW